MATARFNLNARLNFFAGAANAAMATTQAKFRGMQNGLNKVNRGMSTLGQASRGLAIATAPIALVTGFAIKSAATFAAQMSTVQSVLLATREEMLPLNATIKRLGATTIFTSKQAGEGAEFLARAGLKMAQIGDALPGVLDAAAASGITLADSARITANQLGAFGLKASKAGEVADILALTSARTNTTFLELGEALKIAAPAAASLNIPLSQTAATMGVISNTGMKATRAGTALKNALTKLSNPTKKALKIFGGKAGLNNILLDTAGRLRPLPVIMASVLKRISALPNLIEKNAASFEIFGLRGATAFSAFSKQAFKSTEITEKNFLRIVAGAKKLGEDLPKNFKKGDFLPFTTALRLEIAGALGVAKEMAKIRLNNLAGDFKLLTSVADNFNIELGDSLSKNLGLRGLISKGRDFIQIMVSGFQLMGTNLNMSSKALNNLKNNQFRSFLPLVQQFAEGFVEGIKEIRTEFRSVFNDIKGFLLGLTGETEINAKAIGKFFAKAIIIATVLAPAFAILSAALFVIAPLLLTIASAFSILFSTMALVIPILKIVAFTIGFLLTPIGLVVAAIVGLGILAFVFWEDISKWFGKAKDFIVNDFADAMVDAFVFMGDKIKGVLNFINAPLRFFNSLLKGAVLGVNKLTGGGLAKLSTFKSNAEFIANIKSKEGISAIDRFFGTTKPPITPPATAQRRPTPASTPQPFLDIINNKNRTKVLAQPDIAEQSIKIVQAISQGRATSSEGQKFPDKIALTGRLTTKIRGGDLHIALTDAAIRTTELSGRSIDPNTKQNLLVNGMGVN